MNSLTVRSTIFRNNKVQTKNERENETQIPVREILKTIEAVPLIGHKSGKLAKTHWMLFMKC